MKIVLDFDDTIFNTAGLLRGFCGIFRAEGFSEKDFWDRYEKTKEIKGDFDLPTLADLFYDSKKFDRKEVDKKLDAVMGRADVFVYPDFYDLTNRFKKDYLSILSFGTTEFQELKIKNSKIVPYVKEVVVTLKDKVEDLKIIRALNLQEKIIFIEDKASQIDNVKIALPEIITMKMERPEGRHIHQKSQYADYIIKDFNEAIKIISKIK